MMLQSYDQVALALVRAGLALEEHGGNMSKLLITITSPGRAPVFYCNNPAVAVAVAEQPQPPQQPQQPEPVTEPEPSLEEAQSHPHGQARPGFTL